MNGGGGSDTADYSQRTSPVTVHLGSDGGEAGEGDQLAPDIENAIGGSAGDELAGNGGPNKLDGGPGGDNISGGAGADVLTGGAGHDMIASGPGADTVHAVDGDVDTISCGRPTDVLHV